MTPIAGTAKPECSAFGLLSYSKTDSDETVRQIKAHNAAWRAICQPTNPQATPQAAFDRPGAYYCGIHDCTIKSTPLYVENAQSPR